MKTVAASANASINASANTSAIDFAPPRAGRGLAAPRRVPLRATGLLAMLGVVALAGLLVVATLLVRGVVSDDLHSLETALEMARADDARQAQRWLGDLPTDDPAAALRGWAERARQADATSAQLLAEARYHIDAGTVAVACLAWLGITTIGALSLLFFSRIAADIGTLRGRALAIVAGDRSRGPPLARNDELSDLAQAVDSLADAMDRHERELEIERRHVMHHEKLAVIGAMAAGVLREIGNPIAAIDGHARAMQQACANGECGSAPSPPCDPALILHETMRLVAITREISRLAATPAAQWQLASLNEIVGQTISLLRYEPRLERLAVATALDPQLPAVMVVADRLVQLLINLVINAADAMNALPPHAGRIEIATARVRGGVELAVTDNGCGMSAAVLERAFEPLFTTQPAGRSTGLGLPLCRAIAQDHGGSISIASLPGRGARVSVWLPINRPEPPLH